jgi:hypothetical protein
MHKRDLGLTKDGISASLLSGLSGLAQRCWVCNGNRVVADNNIATRAQVTDKISFIYCSCGVHA